jgi:hypothetical protein
MEPPLSRTPIYLPVRIVPARRAQYFLIALQVLGLGILGYTIARQFTGDWQVRATQSPIIFGLFTAFLVLAVLAVLSTLAAALLRLVPESPYFHVALTWESIAVRSVFRTRRFAWSELGRFTVVTAPNDNEINLIVAAAPGDEAGIRSDKDRYRRARFRLRSDPYCNPTDAELLARWLNEIRSAVAGRLPADVAFFAPLALTANLLPGRD